MSNLPIINCSQIYQASNGGHPTIASLFSYITCTIQQSVIPLIFAIAIVVFLWGVVQFVILGQSDETKKTQGKQFMIWGIVALTVMIGVWGLVKIVGNTFSLNTTILPQVKP